MTMKLTEEQESEAALIGAKMIETFKHAKEEVAIQGIINALSLTMRITAPTYSDAKTALEALTQGVNVRMKMMFDT